MTDITVRIDGTSGILSGDWSWNAAGDDVQTGDDLATAVLVSLFTERGSWWGDSYRDDALGSRLHTLFRAKKTAETLRKAEDYARESLRWLVKDGVASKLEAKAMWVNQTRLELSIIITKATGTARSLTFSWVWS